MVFQIDVFLGLSETLIFSNFFELRFFSRVFTQTNDGQSAQLLSSSLSVQEVWGSIPGPLKLDAVPLTAPHHCDVSKSCVAQTLSCGDEPRQ